MKQLDTKLMHPAEQIKVIIGRIYRSGMTTPSGGNVSIMDDNGDMWITPSAIDKGSLTERDIICVKADGTIVGPHKPSSEYPFHKAIYQMRPGMRSVIHAHPPALVSFSITHQIPIPTLSRRRAVFAARSGLPLTHVPAARNWARRSQPSSATTPTTKR